VLCVPRIARAIAAISHAFCAWAAAPTHDAATVL
jgi:hypothetical protein